MSRFDIRVIQNQEEINTVSIPDHERDMLLAKYGYSQNQNNPVESTQVTQNSDTFEDMVKKQSTPSVWVDPNVTYVSDPETGYNFKISINRI